MACNNCYNGCVDIVSDKCLKYTGVNVPSLGIETNDPYSEVIQSITTHLSSVIDGTGIKPVIDEEIICEVVSKHLPVCAECDGISLVDILTAIIKAICELEGNVSTLTSAINTLNADYNVSCLSGVTNSSDTHEVLQAAIAKICGLEIEIDAIALDVDTNYVKISELNSLIAAYLASNVVAGKAYNNMIPYTAVEYYGPLVNFPSVGDAFVAGVGTGYWEKVYLCNGQNGTPDKRGRVAVGVTDGTMAGGPMASAVNPAASPFNPNYSVGSVAGSNSVTLLTTQIPSHSHNAQSVVTDPGHNHTVTNTSDGFGGFGKITVGNEPQEGTASVDSSTTGISVSTTVENTGGGQAHANNQPAIGCYYIMYIP